MERIRRRESPDQRKREKERESEAMEDKDRGCERERKRESPRPSSLAASLERVSLRQPSQSVGRSDGQARD